MQAVRTLSKSLFLRKAFPVFIFLLFWAAIFLWIQIDKAAQSRRDWAAAQDNGDELEFSTSGLLDNTLVITIFPSNRTEEDSLVGFVVHDADWKKLRDGLRSHGFNSIRCGVVEEKLR